SASKAWHAWSRENDIDDADGGSHRLLPLLYRNLQRHSIADPDLDRLKGVYRQTWYRNRISMHAAAGVLRALEAAGIETMVLKGTALAIEQYGESGVRPMNDIDIMVHTPRAEQAAAVLHAAGFRAKLQHDRLGRATEVFHAIGFTNEAGVGIDLHWHLLEECRQPDADDSFWADSHPLEVDGAATRALSATDQLLHVCVHGSRWDPVPPIRWAADAYTLIARNADSIDWKRLVREARRRRLTLNLGGCLTYLREELNASVPEDVLEQLRRSRTSRLERWDYRAQGAQNTLPWLITRYVTRYLRLSQGRPWWKQARDFPVYLQQMWGVESAWQVPRDAIRRVIRRARQAGFRPWRKVPSSPIS
ncbi:MAG: nucleotidyltransferase family protein, partial [Tepidiformaceae bacterium]